MMPLSVSPHISPTSEYSFQICYSKSGCFHSLFQSTFDLVVLRRMMISLFFQKRANFQEVACSGEWEWEPYAIRSPIQIQHSSVDTDCYLTMTLWSICKKTYNLDPIPNGWICALYLGPLLGRCQD